ncbi:MAG: hypothetical protein VKL00_12195 [Synechococcales bacterium]|nr:hypothetical protein [Synechococcales bacterium]
MLGVHISLVRTVQRLSVGFQGYLPPHNFTVRRNYIQGIKHEEL